MKRRALVGHLEMHGCVFVREGAKHTLFYSPASSRSTTVPRHNEIGDRLAAKICRDLGVPPPARR